MLGQLSSTFSFFGRRNLLHDIRMQKPSARSIWEYDAYQTTKTEAPSLQITMKAPSITFLAASSESPTMLTSFHSTSYLAIRSIHGRTQSGMIIQNGQRTTEFLCVYIEYIHISVIYTHPTNVYTINLYNICVYTHNSYVYRTEIKTYQPVVMSQPEVPSSPRCKQSSDASRSCRDWLERPEGL